MSTDYKKLVEKVASLARLELKDAEVPELAKNLESILGYIDRLREVNVQGVEPMSHVHDTANVMREDELQPSMPNSELKSIAPSMSGQFIKVPLIIDQNTEH